MEDNNLISQAESGVVEKDYSAKKNRGIASGKGKQIFAVVLFCILVAVAFNSWKQIQRMNEPPFIPKEELIEQMNSYLFVSVSKLLAYSELNGILPPTEEAFLGWDDPMIEYSTSGGSFTLSVLYADTVISFESGDDPSDLLTEEFLNDMGVTIN